MERDAHLRKVHSSSSRKSRDRVLSKAGRKKIARQHRNLPSCSVSPPQFHRRVRRKFSPPSPRFAKNWASESNALRSTFEREVRTEAGRERILDRLHAELQEYKQDLLLKIQRPIFLDLIQLHDDVGKMAAARAGAESQPDVPGTDALRNLLESIQTAIEDILYRQGVEPFSLETGEFDAKRQRAASTTPTDRAALNKTVAARIRKGFVAGEKLIRPELVSVYVLRHGAAEPEG